MRQLILALLLVVTSAVAVRGGAASDPARRASVALKLVSKARIAPPMTMGHYLDRLMLAESGGNDHAKNPLSSALGPYQFINATWLDLLDRHFADEIGDLTRAEVLALRTDRRIARKAAEVYSRENAELLAAAGIKPSFAHLRLAFLVGGSAAVKILSADRGEPIATLLEPAALRANPFLGGLTVADLLARAEHDLRGGRFARVSVSRRSGKDTLGIKVRCNLRRPSCRKWLALAKRRLRARPEKSAAKP
ncbi:MAG: hypothetical protein R3D57_12815 [Hyphomicrobiaceae bacterium]